MDNGVELLGEEGIAQIVHYLENPQVPLGRNISIEQIRANLVSLDEVLGQSNGDYVAMVDKGTSIPIEALIAAITCDGDDEDYERFGYKPDTSPKKYAKLLLGRIRAIRGVQDELKPRPDVVFEFDGGVVVHARKLQYREGELDIRATRFDKRDSIAWNPEQDQLTEAGIYVATGADVEKLLRKLGFEGDIPQTTEEVYRAMQSQQRVIEEHAQPYFFPK